MNGKVLQNPTSQQGPAGPSKPSGAEGLPAVRDSLGSAALDASGSEPSSPGFWDSIASFFAAIFNWFLSLFGFGEQPPAAFDSPPATTSPVLTEPLPEPAVRIEKPKVAAAAAAAALPEPAVRIPMPIAMPKAPSATGGNSEERKAPAKVVEQERKQLEVEVEDDSETITPIQTAGVSTNTAQTMNLKEFIDKWSVHRENWSMYEEGSEYLADFRKLPPHIQLQIEQELTLNRWKGKVKTQADELAAQSGTPGRSLGKLGTAFEIQMRENPPSDADIKYFLEVLTGEK